MSATVSDRFWAKVDKDGPNGCWAWTTTTSKGYGKFAYPVHGVWKTVRSHRWAYEHLIGPIPDGLQIDHLCRNRACVNPGHMEAVTGRTNVLRGNTLTAAHSRKTHCDHGHPFTPENTHRTAEGWRKCRTCQTRRARERESTEERREYMRRYNERRRHE